MNHEFLRMVADGALVVSNHSGGKDSQAMLIKLREVVPADQLLVVHASLGDIEWPGALELAEKQAADADLPFIVARAEKSLFDMVLRRFESRPGVPSWPSASSRQCTSDLKRGPIAREVRRYADACGYTTVINCLGLRAEESPGRAKKPELHRNATQSNGKRTWFEFLPIQQMKVEEVFATIAAAGQKPHYAYSLGNERLSCVFCIMASRNDLINGARHHPDLLNQYDDLEKSTGYTMHMSRVPIKELVREAVYQIPAFLRSPAQVQGERAREWLATQEGKAAIEQSMLDASATIRELDAARVIPWQDLQDPFTI